MRRAARTDTNQQEIVKQLRSIPGVTVAVGHDDILVGRNNVTYWVEIKSENAVKKTGELRANALRDSQKKIKAEWTGQYLVAWSVEQILAAIGVTK